MYKKFMSILDNTRKGPSHHYFVLKRNIILIMLSITIIPLATMIIISHFQYRAHLKSQTTVPLLSMAHKAAHSFELFMEQRLSTIRFISTAYSFEELSKEQRIREILIFLKKEFSGFVDLGLINSKGDLISYAGPYSLLGKNYSSQTFFQETQIKNKYISNVFLGYRKFPHIVVAVQRLTDDGQTWILRATLDTEFFDVLISSMGFDTQSDVFLINGDGIFQTHSLHYGRTLEKCPFKMPHDKFKSNIVESTDGNNRDIIVVSAGVYIADYSLVIVQPQSVALQSWHALKTELFFVFAVSLAIIVFAILWMTKMLVKRVRESDRKRKNALIELQHTQKLSSIGRLAAGIAHEINNPLAIINEKAGLMKDLVELSSELSNKQKFEKITDSIVKSVGRCKKITHRLLGFSKRIDIKIETININEIIHEVLGFLERDAIYRRIDLRLKLLDSLESILSDYGLIQQALLNLLTNAFAAVEDGGIITIVSENYEDAGVLIRISDNGCGIPENIIKNIFDPFFSTKKERGTGLGLSITYGIVRKLGGQITVDSVEGEGTVFTVTLPAKADSNMEAKI